MNCEVKFWERMKVFKSLEVNLIFGSTFFLKIIADSESSAERRKTESTLDRLMEVEYQKMEVSVCQRVGILINTLGSQDPEGLYPGVTVYWK